MTVQAQNCLLKVLEDPPGTGIIAITTANPANLLPTILSRCQVLKPASKRRIPDAALYRDVLNCFLEGTLSGPPPSGLPGKGRPEVGGGFPGLSIFTNKGHADA